MEGVTLSHMQGWISEHSIHDSQSVMGLCVAHGLSLVAACSFSSCSMQASLVWNTGARVHGLSSCSVQV